METVAISEGWLDRIYEDFKKEYLELKKLNEKTIRELEATKDKLKKAGGKSVFARLQEARAELMEVQKNKSGKNSFSNYNYMQLEDFLPELVKISNKVGISDQITFPDERTAMIFIYNVDNPDDNIVFQSPMILANTSPKQPIQNIGATLTYFRRYLYMLAYNIVVTDEVDSTETAEKLAKESARTRQQSTQQNKQQYIDNITKAIEAETIQGFLMNNNKQSLNDFSVSELANLWDSYLKTKNK